MTLWRIRATVDDRPGYLAVLAASLALRSVNILAVQVHTTEVGAVDDFLVDAPDSLTETELMTAVERGRGRDPWIAPAQAHWLVDPPTHALAYAGRLARDPDALGEVLAALLDADAVAWRPEPGPGRFGFEGTTMRLPDLAGGAYEVTRAAPNFTPAEYARAQALADLAASAAGHAGIRATLLLPDGAEAIVRTAVSDDVEPVSRMHERCTPATRQRRYLGGTTSPSATQLARLLAPARGATLVAEVDGGDGPRIVAMANLIGEGDVAEVALLVEDGWQRRGLGTALLRRLLGVAARDRYAALVAHTQADNAAMLHTVRGLGRAGRSTATARS
jgi:GNAT superfamily N-acetyltransferase